MTPAAPAKERGWAKALDARFAGITDEIVRIPLDYPQRRNWWLFMLAGLFLLALFFVSASVLFANGVGVWGNNIPVNWSLAISNYVWWLGIGHAGTLISALLLLLSQDWRNSLNRFAEAMTLFAVVCAGLYPILHLGRPWLFYWMAPYPNTMDIWPQFKSPLTWDFFAVLTYLIVSVLFWYIGAIPDFASARERAKKRRWQIFYGLLALGWRGSAHHWWRWNQCYRITAALAVPLVVSVHSEISLLFAAGPIPGWNTTVFPPYFVAGAAFSGFAVVSIITVPLRRAFALGDLITSRHLDLLAKLLLATGLMTAYGYVAELFSTYYASEPHGLQTLADRMGGQYWWSYWGAIICNFVPLQLLWQRRFRTSPIALFLISLSVAIGMWFERYMLLVTSLYRDWLVSSWGDYAASVWDWTLYAGTIGVFLVPFLLFVRFLPMISAFEVKKALFEHEEFRRQIRERTEHLSQGALGHDESPRRLSGDRTDDSPLPPPTEKVYGTLAEFDDPERLLAAAAAARKAGWSNAEAYTPFPVKGLHAALGCNDRRVPLIMLAGGIVGALSGYFMQVFTNLDFPLNVGGRPVIAPPAFMLITFELMVLFAVVAGVLSMLILNRLPRLNHPLFDVEEFHFSAVDRFFLLLRPDDGSRTGSARDFLSNCNPVRLVDVPVRGAQA
ncbi:quinol:electron acceptor oxidoreductase subunit ActD [Pacificimonas flava]|uniref:Molybdopterin oxidoreductase n=1 Tax=Pacificimonas flava TaxID=1234595 RepID=M2TRP1_9SPHN|nr:quinol:electron acceptor oxidoreductase subunit ActD [Pacificimonas flava]EMD84446.1 Molybdopterin oxidoreductase [Pacificimonas flava]MBB5279682.1 Ni/Fe-hydrogenase subunit HybB-like protein [Pacificimonas flava]